MCLLVLPVASMCQLCTQTHTHTGSRMLSRCCSRRWRLESGSEHAAYARSSSSNKHKRVALSWPCSEWLHKAQYAKKLSFTCVVALLLFFLLLLLFYLARESSAVSVCGCFVVGILWRFHVFYIIFAFVYVTAPTHSQLQMHDARNGKWESVSVSESGRERKSACGAKNTNKQQQQQRQQQEITNVKINKFIYNRCNL